MCHFNIRVLDIHNGKVNSKLPTLSIAQPYYPIKTATMGSRKKGMKMGELIEAGLVKDGDLLRYKVLFRFYIPLKVL